MCGIVGVVGRGDATEVLLNGLRKLEYRGYDSAGIFVNSGELGAHLVKSVGRIAAFEAKLTPEVRGTTGIGHTRWATNGAPTIENAHPQASGDGRFYLVHNGVIQNAATLRKDWLLDQNFVGETDTEVVVRLLDRFVEEGEEVEEAFRHTLSLLEGSYAFALSDKLNPEVLYVAKNQSPLLIGLGEGFNLVGSDALAMIDQTDAFLTIEDGEYALLTAEAVELYNAKGELIERAATTVDIDPSSADKGTYAHYMLKEIHEQPAVLRRILSAYTDKTKPLITPELLAQLDDASELVIVAAGTSYHAGLVGARLFEKLAAKPTRVMLASELAYHQPLFGPRPLFIFLSQSGETADLRQVLKAVKKLNAPVLTITNVPGSTLAREADAYLPLLAGPEVAVASTKAYTAQLAVQVLLAAALGSRNRMKEAAETDWVHALGLVANAQEQALLQEEKLRHLVEENLTTTERAFFIGRGLDYALALEAALKLKEVSYIQTEGFAAGELKHGTIALIEARTPVVAFITEQKTAAHTRANAEETVARGASVITIAREALAESQDDIVLPDVPELLAPLVAIIPAQLLAYSASVARGLDVDRPRNLAKSVTVE